jgi:uncharacterized protein YecA (UPF0149 family)
MSGDGATAAPDCKSEVVVIEKPCDRPGGISNADKWIIAAIIAVLFALLACPQAFTLSNWLFARFGLPTTSKEGRPTAFGVILHAIVFFLVIRLLMH